MYGGFLIPKGTAVLANIWFVLIHELDNHALTTLPQGHPPQPGHVQGP